MYLIRFFWEAFSLDLFGLNYARSSEEINILSLKKYDYNPRGILGSIFEYFRICYRQFKKDKFRFPKNEETQIICFAATNNQRQALLNVNKKFDHSTFWGMNDMGQKEFPIHWAYYLSVFYIPIILKEYFFSTGYKKRSLRFFFVSYLLTYGFYLVWAQIIKNSRPKAFIVSNDHTPNSMTGVKIAERLGVDTIYIQHANVTKHFPPLNFDYAFLEGKDAEEKYRSVGICKTDITLVGMAKFDKHISEVRPDIPLKSVGICTNFFDELKDISSVIDFLKAHQKQKSKQLNLILRPHPADDTFLKQKKLADKKNIKFSDSKKETSFEFLSEIEAIICGDSSIHLEAVLMNVFPIYYDFSGSAHDHYGFLENKLVDNLVKKKEDLGPIISSLMKEKPNIQHRAKRYCDTIGTEYFGKSTDLIAKKIKEKIDLKGSI